MPFMYKLHHPINFCKFIPTISLNSTFLDTTKYVGNLTVLRRNGGVNKANFY